MATPPTRVQLVQPAVGFLSTASPKTTPTFDVVSGDLLVCIGQYESGGAASAVNAPTWTGTGTWTQKTIAGAAGNANTGAAVIWTCDVTATTTARTVSLTSMTGGSGLMFGFTITQWRNHGGVGTVNSASINTPTTGAPSLSLALAQANSAAQCGNCDWTASDGTTRTWRTVNGSPLTESLYARNTTQYAAYGAYSPDAGSGTITLGLTVPSAQTYAIVGIEVLGTGGAAFTPPVGIRSPYQTALIRRNSY